MNNLTVTEYKNIRVLTTQQIAEAYGTDTKIISKNFSRNKERYIEGKHFICLEGEELKEFNSKCFTSERAFFIWNKLPKNTRPELDFFMEWFYDDVHS